jgi:hypothetical protein
LNSNTSRAIADVLVHVTRNTTVILLHVLYGCKTWSVKLREEHSLRVLESRVLRKVFVPKRDEARGELRRLQYEKLDDVYSPNIRVIKSRTRWAGHVVYVCDRRGA